MPWQNVRTHTNGCELLKEVPNHVVRGVPVEALFALVDHDDPPVDGDRPVELLVYHIPLTVARLLRDDNQRCWGHICGSREKTYNSGLTALGSVHEGWRVQDPRLEGQHVGVRADVHAKLLNKGSN